MEKLLSAFVSFNHMGSELRDDDPVDQLNYLWTANLFFFMATFCGLKQFAGDPIKCWGIAEKKHKHDREFIDSLCWVSNLYVVPFDEVIPVEKERRLENVVTFYRWSFIFFILEAAMFLTPHWIWIYFRESSGSNLDEIIRMVRSTAMTQDKHRHKNLKNVAGYIDGWVATRRLNDESDGRCGRFTTALRTKLCGKRSGRQLVTKYILIKVIYLVNSLCQFSIISSFLGLDFMAFGVTALMSFLNEERWEDHDTFPRVSYCDMLIRQQNNVQTYTVQCVLGMNLFLEKIFILAWFVLVFVSVVNAFSLILWIYRGITDSLSSKFLAHYKNMVFDKSVLEQKDKELLKKVVRNYLRQDGVFMLRLVSRNTDSVLTSELIRHILARFDDVIKEKLARDLNNSMKEEEKEAEERDVLLRNVADKEIKKLSRRDGRLKSHAEVHHHSSHASLASSPSSSSSSSSSSHSSGGS